MARRSAARSGTDSPFTTPRFTEVGSIRPKSKSACSRGNSSAPGESPISRLCAGRAEPGTAGRTVPAPRSTGNSTERLPVSSLNTRRTFLSGQGPRVDFRRDIQPLFQEKCIGCHGPSEQSAGMRLDRRSSAMQARGAVRLGPGNSAASMVYLKISGTRYGTRMPPTGPLDPAQIELIKNWIDQGAEWPDDLAGEKASAPPDPRAARLMESLRSGD